MTEITERVARLEGAYQHLATKADIAELKAATKADIAKLETATKADIAELKTELKTDMARLEAATKADIAELKTNMAKLETDLTEKIGKKINRVAAVTVAVIGILQLVLKFSVP